MMRGWLVNDYLTCIPHTRTLWHDLLDWIPGLEDKTGTPFHSLVNSITQRIVIEGPPDYIIRNASYFPPIPVSGIPTIALLQDPPGTAHQDEVCRRSDVVVAPSDFMAQCCPRPVEVIPLPVSKAFFPTRSDRTDEVLFVGADSEIKGWEHVMNLRSQFPIRVVTKGQNKGWSGFAGVHSRVSHAELALIMNRASALIVPSRWESFHLAGAEAEACGVPILATPVGRYWGRPPGPWGATVPISDFSRMLPTVQTLPGAPRRLTGYDIGRRWRELIERSL